MTGIIGTFIEDVCTCMIISRQVLLRMRNISDKSFRENQNTHLQLNNPPPLPSENCAVHEIMWKKYGTAGQATGDNICNMLHAICILDN